MTQSIAHVALVVRDYDEAIAFFTEVLNFTLVEDTYIPEQDKRWVLVAPRGSTGTSLLLARPSKPGQEAFIGNQTGGRVTFFLQTDDFWRDYHALRSRGVEFARPPANEPYGMVAVFKDLYGNLWDLVGPANLRAPLKATAQAAAGSPMPVMDLHTRSLRLVLQTREDVQRTIEAMSPSQRAELSADWLARLEASAAADPWVHGFRVEHGESGIAVGSCGFKGPPLDGVVEIAYGIAPEQQGKGYATEAAQRLVDFAFTFNEVRAVIAHTLPDSSASKRVLAKCGFRYVGEVVDPDDGLVWRFEKLPSE